MPLDPLDQARVDHLRDKRDALVNAGFTTDEALSIILSEMQFGPIDVMPAPIAEQPQSTGSSTTFPGISVVVGKWDLTPQLNIECGGPGDLGFELKTSAMTAALADPNEGRFRLSFTPDRYASGTITDLGAGRFEGLLVFDRSRVRLRFTGTLAPDNTDRIAARLRFEFDGSAIGGLPLFDTCRDMDLPVTMVRQ